MAEVMWKMMEDNTLWVFGYGSLLWKPCFQYQRQVVGHIKGFKRRFYLGNTNLRGSVSQPGRVAILIPDEQEVAWGVAYEIQGQQNVKHAIEHLYVRENSKGGYYTMANLFYPRPPQPGDSDSSDDEAAMTTPEPFSVLCFTATPSSHLYMGPADLGTMARQVVAAKGQTGTNAEYVLRTAEYVRDHIPEDHDSHLFGLEKKIHDLQAKIQQSRRESLLDHDCAVCSTALQAVAVPV